MPVALNRTLNCFLKGIFTILAGFVLISFCSCSSDSEVESIETSQNSNAILFNEVLFNTSADNEWVELFNPTSNPTDIRSFRITNKTGDVYIIPEDFPLVPSGGYVVIQFDGLGSSQNDYDFTDGCAFLHSETVYGDVFDDESDTCSIFPKGVREDRGSIDFVAWGDYGHRGNYINNEEQYGGSGPVFSNQTIGIHPDIREMQLPTSWVIYARNESTKGFKNLIPAPVLITPYRDSTIRDGRVSFAWRDWLINVKGFSLEVDDSEDFASPVLMVETKSSVYKVDSPLNDGIYYWRVRTITSGSEMSAWSMTRKLTVQKKVRSRLIRSNDLEIEPVLQRKDTSLLCPACYEHTPPNSKIRHPWNEPHEKEKKSACPHCKVYCGRACIVMINKHFEGHITQDWISYQIYSSKTDPADQLGHYDGFDGPDMKKAQAIALKGGPEVPLVKFSFETVMEYIDQNRAIIGYIHPVETDEREQQPPDKHVVVIDGYDNYEDDAEDTLHVLQPFTGEQEPVTISETKIVWISAPPANSEGVVMKEDLDADNDNDKVKDFDEKNRFFTDFASEDDKDTDEDGLTDFIEIRAWAHGKGLKPRYPDLGWGIWKDMSKDFDNDTIPDGEEDLNANGTMDPGECDPFVYERPFMLSLSIAGAALGSPTAKLNGQDIGLKAYTGSKVGYRERIAYIPYCKTLRLGQNTLTITAFESETFGLDDIQIGGVEIKDLNQPLLLSLFKDDITYHLGNRTVQTIWDMYANGDWSDPNPPGFWVGLHGPSVQYSFDWNPHPF